MWFLKLSLLVLPLALIGCVDQKEESTLDYGYRGYIPNFPYGIKDVHGKDIIDRCRESSNWQKVCVRKGTRFLDARNLNFSQLITHTGTASRCTLGTVTIHELFNGNEIRNSADKRAIFGNYGTSKKLDIINYDGRAIPVLIAHDELGLLGNCLKEEEQQTSFSPSTGGYNGEVNLCGTVRISRSVDNNTPGRYFMFVQGDIRNTWLNYQEKAVGDILYKAYQTKNRTCIRGYGSVGDTVAVSRAK